MSKALYDENIELSLPLNAAYVSAARLTASSIANRLGFDIDEIEDIKVAVSESCTYIIKRAGDSKTSYFKLGFYMKDNQLKIKFISDITILPEYLDEDMSLIMVKAMMDTIIISKTEDGNTEMVMTKTHQIGNF